jgi:uncharacterized membrane protein
MTLFIIGLILFLGLHSIRVVAPGIRTGFIVQYGANAWKGLYSLVSIIGLCLLVYGYGEARLDTVQIWSPPKWALHLNMTLMLIAIILLVASQLPAGRIAVWAKHPMVLGVKVWALAHLLVKGTLVAMVLFAAFLAWGVILRIYYKRAQRAGTVMPRSFVAGRWDVLAILMGGALYAFILMLAHEWIIGISPLDMMGLQ